MGRHCMVANWCLDYWERVSPCSGTFSYPELDTLSSNVWHLVSCLFLERERERDKCFDWICVLQLKRT